MNSDQFQDEFLKKQSLALVYLFKWIKKGLLYYETHFELTTCGDYDFYFQSIAEIEKLKKFCKFYMDKLKMKHRCPNKKCTCHEKKKIWFLSMCDGLPKMDIPSPIPEPIPEKPSVNYFIWLTYFEIMQVLEYH
jgi:hypothetical protein